VTAEWWYAWASLAGLPHFVQANPAPPAHRPARQRATVGVRLFRRRIMDDDGHTTTKRISAFEEVFVCSMADRAVEITWTKFPVARNSVGYRRLMETSEGRDAYAVFIGALRLVCRGRTGGYLTVKGHPMTDKDIASETGIPVDVVRKGLEMLASTHIGWIVETAQESRKPRASGAQATRKRRAPRSYSVSESESLSFLRDGESEGKGKCSVPVPASLNTPEFLAAWAEWLQHRREQRKPATPTAQRRVLNTLEKRGPEKAVADIRHSVGNGWTGIFQAEDVRGQSKQRGARDPQQRRAGEYEENIVLPVFRG